MPLSIFRLCLALAAAAALAACEAPQPQVSRPGAPVVQAEAMSGRLSPREAASNFVSVAETMRPRIAQECAERTHGQQNCNYRIVVDDRPASAPNAFQTVDNAGNPVIAFNLPLIAEARNRDELAFVMGHEAAHHILGHLESKTQDAAAGAMIMGVLAAASGADPAAITQAQSMGADVGGRAYSKNYELAADRLGTIIAWDAGYDPLRGAEFFTRLSDPGDRFLGTHPANGARMELVRQTVAELRAGRL